MESRGQREKLDAAWRRAIAVVARDPRWVGASAAVAIGGGRRERLWSGVGGLRAPGGHAPPDAARPQPIFSVAKPMLAAAALRLAERGRLRLDDRLSRWLPDLSGTLPLPDATIEDLLAHRAGMPAGGELALRTPEWERKGARESCAVVRLERALASGLRGGTAGGEALYSNVGYLALGVILERASGERIARVLEREVFFPAKLRATFVVERAEELDRLAPGWSFAARFGADDDPVDARTTLEPEAIAHVLCASTAFDLVRFWRALFAGALVSREGLTRMCRAGLDGTYGLGVVVDRGGRNGPVYGHAGHGMGWCAWSAYAPERAQGRGACVAVLTNSESGAIAERLGKALLSVL